LLSGVFVLAPDSLDDDDDEDAPALLGVASGSDGEDEDAFVPSALAGAGEEGASEDGVGAAGTVNERLGLFVPIMAEASVADER
jgi:hypothetical protein